MALFVNALKWKLKWKLNFLIHLGLQLLWKISPLKCKIRTEKVIQEMGSRKRVLLRHDTICLMVWLSTTNLQERQVAAIFFSFSWFFSSMLFPHSFSFYFLFIFLYFLKWESVKFTFSLRIRGFWQHELDLQQQCMFQKMRKWRKKNIDRATALLVILYEYTSF